jgi:two-component system, OmpR family, KDP operon response regulator KdpE
MATALNIRNVTGWIGHLWQHAPERADVAEHDVIETGEFRIDLRSHRVTVRGQEVELSGEEFEMLVFLAGHPKKIVTPRTLLSTRWGEREVRQTDFLRVLQALRNKLEPIEGCTGCIRTEPWIFYRFDPGR